MTMKQWMYRPHRAKLDLIADRYHISENLAEILIKRGLYDWESMDEYLYPGMDQISRPQMLKDAGRAAGLLWEKIQNHRRICVIGDYDVDGIMSSYILVSSLQRLGGDVIWRLPHRVRDGYGIRDYMVEEAVERGADTIITCDNGISALAAAEKAREAGVTYIITDHHEIPRDPEGNEVIPVADAVVDPHQEACPYPWKQICGGVVAWQLMRLLYEQYAGVAYDDNMIVFAAIATVGDVMPLKKENRVIVREGLARIDRTGNCGLDELIRLQEFQRAVTARDIGFRIGPCLNAAGRLEDAGQALELLLEDNPSQAEKRALELFRLNEERKTITQKAVDTAEEEIRKMDLSEYPVLVLALEDCPESVAGIVAGRIREKYYRPAMILTGGQERWKASGRSIPGYHMQRELTACQDLLLEYGGHALAAGFSLLPDNLEAFRERLYQNCTLTQEDFTEKISLDCVSDFGVIGRDQVEELELLEPLGQENEGALFAHRAVDLARVYLCGREKQIGKFTAREGGQYYTLTDFHVDQGVQAVVVERYGQEMWDALLAGRAQGCLVDVLYIPEISSYSGNVEFIVRDSR